METIEQIFTRQHATLSFSNGKVEYFSVSTQWNTADTIEEAINNILEADKKHNGKAPLNSALNKFNNNSFTREEVERILNNIDKSYYSLLSVKHINEV